MKIKHVFMAIVLTFAYQAPGHTQELTGDVKLACEALLCLSSGTRPSECAPSLARYFSISFRKFSDTIRGRINFLNLCPTSSAEGIPSLVNAIAYGAGSCEPDSLNARLELANVADGDPSYIDNNLPGECATYASNPYTSLRLAYEGVPGEGGRWVTQP